MEGSDIQQNFRASASHRDRGVSHPLHIREHRPVYCYYTSSSTSPFLPGCGVYLHGRPVSDVILLSQLLAGEVHVLLPQPLAFPTRFLRRITTIKGREDPAHH